MYCKALRRLLGRKQLRTLNAPCAGISGNVEPLPSHPLQISLLIAGPHPPRSEKPQDEAEQLSVFHLFLGKTSIQVEKNR